MLRKRKTPEGDKKVAQHAEPSKSLKPDIGGAAFFSPPASSSSVLGKRKPVASEAEGDEKKAKEARKETPLLPFPPDTWREHLQAQTSLYEPPLSDLFSQLPFWDYVTLKKRFAPSRSGAFVLGDHDWVMEVRWTPEVED